MIKINLLCSVADSFGEDWMETVDFKTLLDSSVAAPVPEQQRPVKNINTEEPRKEGMKASAFEQLKALLLGNQPLKSDFTITIEEQVSPPTPPPVPSPVAEVPNLVFPEDDQTPAASFLDFTQPLDNNVTFDMLLDSDGYVNPFESIIQPEVSLDYGDVTEIEQSTDGPLIASIELLDTISKVSPSVNVPTTSINDSLSVVSEVNDSFLLASEPSSPFCSTVDASQFSDSDYSAPSSVKSSKASEQDFKLKTKSKKDKVRASPYDSDYDNIYDKKIRKKMQNKNAATRYRVKKRVEKESLQEQEVQLCDKNKELKEKVESLQREIKYMKELMTEINKAKQRKI